MNIEKHFQKNYAKDTFPWADIDSSLTTMGLLRQRSSGQRATWGRVLQGTDAQLSKFILTYLPIDPVNFNAPKRAAETLAIHLVPELERVIDKGIPLIEARNWFFAYTSGMKHE